MVTNRFVEAEREVTDLFLMCCREPRHLNWPCTIIARRVHKASHSSMLKDANTTKFVFPKRSVFSLHFNANHSFPLIMCICI